MALLDGVAEAIRRLFGSPKVGRLVPPALEAAGRGLPLFRPAVVPVPWRMEAACASADFFPESSARLEALEPLCARLQVEDAWSRWAAGANVLGMDVFSQEVRLHRDLAALQPPSVRRLEPPRSMPVSCRTLREPLRMPRLVNPGAGTFSTRAYRDLRAALRRPVVFRSENVQSLPKALWMRYSLALVRATGENVRNLEVIGLWRLPRQGVSALRPESSGRLVVQLAPAAAGSPRAAFMVARRRDDNSLVSAFVE